MKRIIPLYLLFFLPFLTASCELMEMENEEVLVQELHLDRDTLWIMVGDEFSLQPSFKPDSVSIPSVIWTTSASNVLSIEDGVFRGTGVGWAQVHARSITANIEDSCMVCVMRRWEDASKLFPYEMMVYASVTVNGKAFDPETMIIGAFVDGDMRGVGSLEKWKDSSYVRFRIGSELRYVDPNGFSETVSFRVYYKKELRYEEFPQTLDYDGETHGTLSNLFTLKIG